MDAPALLRSQIIQTRRYTGFVKHRFENVAKQATNTCLNCTICCQTYKRPKVLPCLHTFCEQCLNDYIPAESISVTCPICKHQSIIPVDGVSALQRNSYIEGIMNSMATQHSDEKSTCSTCKEQEIVTQKCVQCSTTFCDGCSSAHKQNELTNTHDIVNIDNGLVGNGNAPSEDIKCPMHDGQAFHFYCTSCETAICESCSQLEHQEHAFIPLKEAIAEHKATLESLLTNAKAKAPAINAAIATVDNICKSLTNSFKTAENDTNTWFDTMSQLLTQRKAMLLEDLKSAYGGKVAVLKNQKDDLYKLLNTIDSCCELTTNALEHGNDTEIILIKKEMAEKLQILATSTNKKFLPEENDMLMFTDTDTDDVKASISTFGRVQTNSAVAFQTTASGDGLKRCFTNIQTVITVTTKDRNGTLVADGSADIDAELVSNNGDVVPIEIADNLNGTYDITFRTKTDGRYHLDVKLFGQPIRASPFRIKSMPIPEGYQKDRSPTKIPRSSSSVAKRSSKRMSSSGRSHGSNHRKSNPIEDDLIDRIGTKGRNKGEFTNPQGLCASAGRILVADSNNQNIQVFCNKGDFKFRFGIRGRNAGQMQRPTGVFVTMYGNYVVADYDNRWVSIYSPDGKYLNKIGQGKLLGPKGITVDRNGHIIVVDNKASCICVFQSNGKMLHKFGTRGNGESQLAGPHYVAVNSNNDIIVSDFHNHCIKVFDSEGKFLFSFGSNGEGNGQFNAPTGVAVDSHGNILVADWGNSRIQIFDSCGSFLSYINSSVDPLYGPQGLAVTSDGNVVVADSGNHCLKVYKYLQ
ncbi:tripartite motif-containing protein 2-like [Tubulanus polymorphus]|uniref:tripartite motif-containing protein 2-like n=1 Tax=Tubulanus polymorphus TaxID=672921 RepID=UPI003DA4DD5C